MTIVPLSDHEWATVYKLEGEQENDRADRHLFSTLHFGSKTASPLHVMTSDGMIDDPFGSWTDPDGVDDEGSNSDDYTNYILQL